MAEHIISGSVINPTNPLDVNVVSGIVLPVGDLEMGAVEIKNATDDTRATVGANGLYVDVRDLPATEKHLGATGGNYFSITMTPTLTVGATYAANDFVGTSNVAIIFANAGRVNGGTGRIVDATLYDYVAASVAAELWIFEAAPAGLGLDSAAFTITDADDLTCVGVILFNTYQASALNSHSDGEMKNGSIGFTCAVGSKSLFGALVTRGAPAYTNGLVSVRIGVAQD